MSNSVVLSEEKAFHDMLTMTMERTPDGGYAPGYVPIFADASTDDNTILSQKYRQASENSRIDLEKELSRCATQHSIDGTHGKRAKSLSDEAKEARCERDFWSLVDSLGRNQLFHDLDVDANDKLWREKFDSMNAYDSIMDVIRYAYVHNEVVKKGHVLQGWLEECAVDKCRLPPKVSSFPWQNTLRQLHDRDHKMRITSIHPDGQLTKDCQLLPLHKSDAVEQEQLLKAIWQLIRSGQVEAAMQLAKEHETYWLKVSLSGALLSDDNIKRSIWLKTCYNYCSGLYRKTDDKLATAADNNSYISGRGNASVASILEMSVYASLSNNLNVLLSSPLLPDWSDKLWAVVKVSHEDDLLNIIGEHRRRKQQCSLLFPESNDSIFRAERYVLHEYNRQLMYQSRKIGISNCIDIFSLDMYKVPALEKGFESAESFILLLQQHVISGYSSIMSFINTTIITFLYDHKHESKGHARISRIICHFFLWLRNVDDRVIPAIASANSINSNTRGLRELVSDDLLYLSIEKYIDFLIWQKHYSLVAVYAVHLCRPKRISKYVELLHSIPQSQPGIMRGDVLGQTEAEIAVKLAEAYFPADISEITRSVVENIREQPVAASQVSASPTAALSGNVRFSATDSVAVTPDARPYRKKLRSATPFNRSYIADATPMSIQPNQQKQQQLSTPSSSSLKGTSSTARDERTQLLLLEEIEDMGISDDDMNQIKSLQWFYISQHNTSGSYHSLEAIRQVNSIVTSFVLSQSIAADRVASIRKILAEVPPSVVKDADRFFHIDSSRNDFDEVLRVNWTSCRSKLLFWRKYVTAMTHIKQFGKEMASYEAEKSSIIGPEDVILSSTHALCSSKLASAASIATDSILQALGASPTGAPCNGIGKIFSDARVSALDMVRYNRLKAEAIHKTGVASHRKDDSTYNELVYDIDGLVGHLYVTYPGVADDVRDLKQLVESAEVSQDDEAVLMALLAKCKQHLQDVYDGEVVVKKIVYQLLTNYYTITRDMARQLISLRDVSGAHGWYSLAIQVSVLLASEDPTLRLYDNLHPSQLQHLVREVNDICIEMLKYVQEFSIKCT